MVVPGYTGVTLGMFVVKTFVETVVVRFAPRKPA
jgi:hypothetical protein